MFQVASQPIVLGSSEDGSSGEDFHSAPASPVAGAPDAGSPAVLTHPTATLLPRAELLASHLGSASLVGGLDARPPAASADGEEDSDAAMEVNATSDAATASPEKPPHRIFDVTASSIGGFDGQSELIDARMGGTDLPGVASREPGADQALGGEAITAAAAAPLQQGAPASPGFPAQAEAENAARAAMQGDIARATANSSMPTKNASAGNLKVERESAAVQPAAPTSVFGRFKGFLRKAAEPIAAAAPAVEPASGTAHENLAAHASTGAC